MAMKKSLKIALLQLAPPRTSDEAQVKAQQYCKEAATQSADIVLFPELWNTGYRFPNSRNQHNIEEWSQRAVTRTSDYVQSFGKLAKSLNIAVAATYLEDCGEVKPKNSITLFDRHGEECLHYSKVHTCDFGDEILLEHGAQFKVATLDTAAGKLEVGTMICFDRKHPESARILMLQGAEIIIVPNASNLRKAQLQQFSTRAFENMVGVAMANYPAPKHNGHSVAFSPITEDEGQNDIDNCLVQANDQEGIYYAEFDMESIRLWRKRQIWGNAYRKPRMYTKIVD